MGVLKEKSTIIIAVWGSILLHTVFLLGFGLAFSDKRNNFPEPEPRFVTLLSVSPVLKQSQEHDFSKENVPAKVTEKVVYDKPEPVKKNYLLKLFRKNQFQRRLPVVSVYRLIVVLLLIWREK